MATNNRQQSQNAQHTHPPGNRLSVAHTRSQPRTRENGALPVDLGVEGEVSVGDLDLVPERMHVLVALPLDVGDAQVNGSVVVVVVVSTGGVVRPGLRVRVCE